MCVSYRKINFITKPFQFLVPHCDDAIGTTGAEKKIWIINLDTRQGYHQISVRHIKKEKIAFFSIDNQKYKLLVMSFGTSNFPCFYSAMMKIFKDECGMIFIDTLCKIVTLIN